MNKLKVGDIVTANGEQWLKGHLAKIINIVRDTATIELLEDISKYMKEGYIDGGWDLEWLVKAYPKQVKLNNKESVAVMRDFKIGDKVKVANKSRLLIDVLRVNVGDTATIEEVKSTGSYKIRMDKDNDYWHAKPEEIELVKAANVQNLQIIIEGTTTKVRFNDGRTGTAGLYHKDTYSKGFGVVVALGKALNIDLVEEVMKVVKSYDKPTKEEIKAFADSTKLTGNKFKVGDIIRGIDKDHYTITNIGMKQAEVIEIGNDVVKIKVLEHEENHWIGHIFKGLNPKYFELVETPLIKFEVGCKVKIPKTKKGSLVDGQSTVIRRAERRGQDHLFLIRIDKYETKDIYVLGEHKEDSTGDHFHLIDLETYEETSSIKKPILKDEFATRNIEDFKVGDRIKIVDSRNSFNSRLKVGSEGIITSIDDDFIKIKFDELPNNLQIISSNYERINVVGNNETKIETVSFKIGDKVRVRKDLISDEYYDDGCCFVENMKKYIGMEAEIIKSRYEDTRFGLNIDNDHYSWSPSMLEKIEEKIIAPVFKVGDLVRVKAEMILGKTYGNIDLLQCMKEEEGISRKIKRIDPDTCVMLEGSIYWWNPSMLELVEEKTKDECTSTKVATELKVGDRVYYKSLSGGYTACEISRVEGKEVWGMWSNKYFDTIEELPKTVKEFESHRKNSCETYVILKDGNIKKLVLIDDTKEIEFKIGDKVKMISNKPSYGWGEVKVGDIGVITNIHENGEMLVDFPNQNYWSAREQDIELVVSKYKVGDVVTKEQAIDVLNNGGRIKKNEYLEYFLKDGVLFYKDHLGDSKSTGYDRNFVTYDIYIVTKI